MRVFIIGVTGRVGALVARRLVERGDEVRGLVRRREQQRDLRAAGVDAVIGDLTAVSSDELAAAYGDAQVVLHCAGSEGEDVATTDALDRDGVVTALEAVRRGGHRRFVLLSVMPEAWRERALGDELEHYFATKKRVDVVVARSGVDWLIVRPSRLTDDRGTDGVAVGPAELHEHVPRADVAAVLAELVHRPGITRRILELNRGSTPVAAAVDAASG